jgi:hypothetical protein
VPFPRIFHVSDRVDPSPSCRIIGVTGNEAPDWEVTGALTANLRAERSGAGAGRIYTLTIECRDATGNAARASALVTVPHDRSR